MGAIALGGIVSLLFLRAVAAQDDHTAFPLAIGRIAGITALAIFFGLLIGLPLIAAYTGSLPIDLLGSFYRSGSLVFGGGHVVLPLLQSEAVPSGWVTNDQFLAGYGGAQAVPGPLFAFAAYLGAVIGGGWAAVLCLVAVFAPSFLLVIGVLPFWEGFRRRPWAQPALSGVHASVVELLLAALYDPVWTAGIKSPVDFAIGAAAFLLLYMWDVKPWLVVILCALAAGGVSMMHMTIV